MGWRRYEEVIEQTVSFLLLCMCVCGAEGGLSGHDQVSKVATAAKYLQPSSFTITCTIVKYSLPVS